MKRLISFATVAAAAMLMSAAASAQDTTTTTQVTTTHYQGSPNDIGSWSDQDRANWVMRNLRPSEKYRFQQVMDDAPANIDILMVQALSNVQQMALQQVMMLGSDYSFSTTPVTTTTTTVTPDQGSTSNQTTTTVTTTTTKPSFVGPPNNIGYTGGRMNDLQATDALLMNLDQNGRSAVVWWMETLTDGDRDIVLKVVKDAFDPNADSYPFGIAWNRIVWSNHTWRTDTYRGYNY